MRLPAQEKEGTSLSLEMNVPFIFPISCLYLPLMVKYSPPLEP